MSASKSAGAAGAAKGAKGAGATAGYEIFSLADSARGKGMWAGALERAEIPGLTGVYPREPAVDESEGSGAAGAAPEGPAGEAPDGFEFRGIAAAHTPALLKIIDEALVNASDHWAEHRSGAKRVTRISLDFDAATGRVVVENDGPGIPVLLHAAASAKAGHDVYVPEVAFAQFLAGRNMEKSPDSVKGGINGIGAKLITVHSAELVVETVAPDAGGALAVYVQVFRDRMRAPREPPRIFAPRSAAGRALPAARRAPHTRIEFAPAYAELGYAAPPAAADAADLAAWCRWRMFLLAAYVGPRVRVTFNGAPCPTTSARALVELAVGREPGVEIFDCPARPTAPPACAANPWDLAVAVVPGARRFGHISVINGVHCAKGGHLAHLKKLLGAAVGARLARATKARGAKPAPADACRQLFLVVVGGLPGADWGGQRKDDLQVAPAKLSPYAPAAVPLARLAAAAAASLLRGAEKAVAVRKTRVEANKYTRARRAGTRDSAACSLLVAEGDSAIVLLRAGLTLGAKKNPGGPSFERYGVFSLGGVIINALKKVTVVPGPGGRPVVVRSEQLRKNKVLTDLVAILGLDYTCRYETDAEAARLRYGAVIIATDQDLDGTGKILPLVLVWFHVFWPALIARGFVKRYMTPVIRVRPRKGAGGAGGAAAAAALEFYYEHEFERWAEAQGGEAAVARAFTVKYYKGLATHDSGEVVEMFGHFARDVYTFTLGDEAAALFEVYFGADAAPRRAALATPVAYPAAAEAAAAAAARAIPCATQLRVDAKAYKLDDIQRKIPGAADGIPVARRKVLAGSLRRFAASAREVKVFQLGGYIAEHMFYHHGDASLNATIVGMAQRFPGALQYPYLTGVGQYGTRHGKADNPTAGSDAGSPRYLNVRLAGPYARAMFPAADGWALPYVFEDGERAQPRYFVGVLPTALFESFEIPSEGWRHKSFARDFGDVLALARAFVGPAAGAPARDAALVGRVAAAVAAGPPGGAVAAAPGLDPVDLALFRARFPLAVSLRGYGEGLAPAERAQLLRPRGGYLHSFGWYEVAHGAAGRGGAPGPTTIRVTELPIRKSTHAFLRDLKAPARARLIAEVDDDSSERGVDVRIRLAPGAWVEVCARFGDAEVDPVEDFLLLRASLRPFLNYYGADGGVVEFGDDYHALFFYWAPRRRDLYRRRLEREAALLGLRLRLERETVRFVGVAHELALGGLADEDAASAALAARGFPPLDAGLLRAPGFAPTEDLARLATEGGAVSHGYLLDLRERDLLRAAQARRAARVAEMEARLAAVGALLAERPFAGASVWAAEIEAVVAAVARGEASDWKF